MELLSCHSLILSPVHAVLTLNLPTFSSQVYDGYLVCRGEGGIFVVNRQGPGTRNHLVPMSLSHVPNLVARRIDIIAQDVLPTSLDHQPTPANITTHTSQQLPLTPASPPPPGPA